MLLAKCYQQRESFICSWVPCSKNPTVLQKKNSEKENMTLRTRNPENVGPWKAELG